MKRRDLLLAVLSLLVIWQLVAWILNRPILPSPVEVAGVFVDELNNGLMEHFLASLWRVLASTFLAIVIAAPIGLVGGLGLKPSGFASYYSRYQSGRVS